MSGESACVRIYPISDVPKFIVEQINLDLSQTDEDGNILGEIYQEQLDYIRFKNPQSYFFAAFDGDDYLGGTFLFLDTVGIVDAPTPAFQGIAKSLFGMSIPIKLNSLLIPAIKHFLAANGYDRVFVNPLKNQRKILLDHYNFAPINGEISEVYKVYWRSPVLISKF